MKQKSTVTKHRVTPFNIKNGNKAPYFIVETSNASKKDEVMKSARTEFRMRSTLSKFPNWDIEVEKI